jgi:hypothetical protein
MNARHIIAFLLVLAISLATAVHPSNARASLRTNSEDEPKLTPTEEREASDVARHFSERLKETNDVGPIVDEMFVSDYSERLRQSTLDSLPLAFLDKSLIAKISRDELRRYYVVALNFYLLANRLTERATALKKQADDDEEVDLEDVITPEMMSVLLSDPTIAGFIQELKKDDEEDGRAKKDDSHQPAESGDSPQAASATTEADDNNRTKTDEIGIIKDASALNGISGTAEKVNELMRKRLATMPAIAQASPDSEDADSQDSPKPDLTRLDEGEYGYPEGTQVIHVNVMPFCLYLIKTGGQLKILSASVYVD